MLTSAPPLPPGLSQRHCSSFFPHLLDDRGWLKALLTTFVAEHVSPRFPRDDCAPQLPPPPPPLQACVRVCVLLTEYPSLSLSRR